MGYNRGQHTKYQQAVQMAQGRKMHNLWPSARMSALPKIRTITDIGGRIRVGVYSHLQILLFEGNKSELASKIMPDLRHIALYDRVPYTTPSCDQKCLIGCRIALHTNADSCTAALLPRPPTTLSICNERTGPSRGGRGLTNAGASNQLQKLQQASQTNQTQTETQINERCRRPELQNEQ